MTIKGRLRNYLYFIWSLLYLDGCAFALIYIIDPNKVKINNGVLVGIYPLKVTLVAGIIAFIIIQISFKITKNRLSAKDMICTIEIFLYKKSVKVKTLVDSGNMLKEPISGTPVVVVEKSKVEKIIPRPIIEIMKIKEGNVSYYENSEYINKIRIIPFSSLGKKNGMITGIKADKIYVFFKDKCYCKNNVVIGIYDDKLNEDNQYNALIGIDFVGEG